MSQYQLLPYSAVICNYLILRESLSHLYTCITIGWGFILLGYDAVLINNANDVAGELTAAILRVFREG